MVYIGKLKNKEIIAGRFVFPGFFYIFGYQNVTTMLIKKQDLDLINDFVEHNESKEGTYNFPHIDKQISDYLKEPVQFLVRNYPNDYHASIRTERLILTIIEGDQFVWKIYLKDATLQGMLDVQHLVNLLVDYKIAITEAYNSILPEVKRLIEFDELHRSSRWGLHNLNDFYQYFSPKQSDLDTEVALKTLNKMKFEDWDGNVFYTSYDGKRESIDYYRRLFKNFATCVEQIKNLQLDEVSN
jgi:hypothetical protein